MIRDIEDGGDAEPLEGEGEGFGEAAEVPNVDEVRLKFSDGGEKVLVVGLLELDEIGDAEPGMSEEAVEAEVAADAKG